MASMRQIPHLILTLIVHAVVLRWSHTLIITLLVFYTFSIIYLEIVIHVYEGQGNGVAPPIHVEMTQPFNALQSCRTIFKLLSYCMSKSRKIRLLLNPCIVHKLQKWAIRLILFASYCDDTKPMFRKLSILNIHDLCRTHMLSFVDKSCNGLLPIKYKNYFTFTEDKHYCPTRSSNDYNLYSANAHKACRANAPINRGPKYWNALPIDSKICQIFRYI